MKTLATLTAAAALMSSAAFAADLYSGGGMKDGGSSSLPVSAQNWAGFYLGGNVGYGWAGTRGDTAGAGYLNDATVPYTGILAQPSADGLTGGVQAGANIQRGPFVFGVVADIQGADLKGESLATVDVYRSGDVVGKLPLAHSQTVDWFGTVRAKAGLSVDHVLVYGTGGFAYGSVTDKISTAFPGDTNYSVSNGGVRSGYTVGGGVDYGVGQWSFGVEYLYVNLGAGALGTDAVLGEGGTVHFSTGDINSDFHVVRGTVSYHLN